VVTRSVALGVGITCFSGDKLVGGPQAGIIVGKKELVAKLKQHPLARAVRIDKIRLAGLTATLLHYLKGEATAKIPVWRMITAPLDEVARRADKWADVLGELAEVVDGETMVGGGSLPGGSLPTKLVAIWNGAGRTTAQSLSRKLRSLEIPVIGRIGDDRLFLDPRSVLSEEDEIVCRALRAIAPGRK
jgi:L-seryl-tRNA(Ser) seleniumtransferase